MVTDDFIVEILFARFRRVSITGAGTGTFGDESKKIGCVRSLCRAQQESRHPIRNNIAERMISL